MQDDKNGYIASLFVKSLLGTFLYKTKINKENINLERVRYFYIFSSDKKEDIYLILEGLTYLMDNDSNIFKSNKVINLLLSILNYYRWSDNVVNESELVNSINKFILFLNTHKDNSNIKNPFFSLLNNYNFIEFEDGGYSDIDKDLFYFNLNISILFYLLLGINYEKKDRKDVKNMIINILSESPNCFREEIKIKIVELYPELKYLFQRENVKIKNKRF